MKTDDDSGITEEEAELQARQATGKNIHIGGSVTIDPPDNPPASAASQGGAIKAVPPEGLIGPRG